MGTSSTKAKNKWNAANYDRIVISVPKGSKDKIKSNAALAGKSLNKYIIDSIEKEIQKGVENVEINVNEMIHITIDDDLLLSWSQDIYTGIYTFVQTDKTVWIYDSKIKKLYNHNQIENI